MSRQSLSLNTSLTKFPISKYREFCNILNTDHAWVNVAVKIQKRGRNGPRFTTDDINLFKRSESPTEEMLNAWKTDNPAFKDLIEILRNLDLHRCVSFIEELLPISRQPDQCDEEISYKVSYKTVTSWTNNFNNFVAAGGFADVYKGKKDSQMVAVKRFKANNLDMAEMFNKEVLILSLECGHPNLLRLLNYSHDSHLCLIYEYMDNGSLYDHLLDKKKVSLLRAIDRLNIADEVNRGLAYLHSNAVVHRDIKSSNILLNESMTAKIGDFGTIRKIDKNLTHAVTSMLIGTILYMAPEYLHSGKVSFAIDMYSFGLVLIELLKGLPAHDEHRDNVNILDIIEDDFEPDLSVEDWKMNTFTTLVNLSKELMNKNKDKRPSADQVEGIIRQCKVHY